MNFTLPEFFEFTVYFLATINPASKVFLLASMDPPYSQKELFHVSCRSSLAAFLILGTLASVGNILLVRFFRIDIYSLSIAGGIVLFLAGLKAVQEGRFYEKQDLMKVPDLSIVPLAAPLIAGPGMIAASISIAGTRGIPFTVGAVAAAILCNLLIMLTSLKIGNFLNRIHAIGPIVRITGLIVMSMAMQMILNGAGQWMKAAGFPLAR